MRMKKTVSNLSQRTFTCGAFDFVDNHLFLNRAKQRGKGAPKKKRTAEREWSPQASLRHLPDFSISRVQEVCAQKEEENCLDKIYGVDQSGFFVFTA